MSGRGTSRWIECGYLLEDGRRCKRRLRPGERCVDHGVVAPSDGSQPKPKQARRCSCSNPIFFRDEEEERCIRCGRQIPDRPRKAFKPRTKAPPAAPSPALFPGEQMELDV